MIRLLAIFGLIAGGVLAAGQLTAAQWHAAGAALLALTLTYGLTVLPWLLAALLSYRCWRWRHAALFWRGAADRYLDSIVELKGTIEDLRQAQRRKRVSR
jgi:hypothetical protein